MGADSPIWFPILGVLAYFAATRGGICYLLIFDMAASLLMFGYSVSLGGIRIDSTDITLAAIAYLTLSGRDTRLKTLFWKLPGIRLWIFTGIALSLSYALVPVTAVHMTDPLRAVYQLYRYCWRTLFFYPIAAVVALDQEQATKVLRWLIVLGTIAALYSIVQALSGEPSTGFFHHKNRFAGSLLVPAIAALGLSISGKRSLERLRWIGCLAFMVLALLFAGSRGAVVAAVGGFACLAMPMTRYAGSRRRLFRMAIAGAFVAVVGLATLSTEGPVGRMDSLAELSEGAEVDNLQWRMQLRWPHFWAKALEHPWFGIGFDRDPSLGDSANTPHNGYLSFLVRNGFPASIAWVLLLMRSSLAGVRVFNRRRAPTISRFLGLTAGAAVAGVLIHNIVESTFVAPWFSQIVLITAGIAAASGLAAAKPAVAPGRNESQARRRKIPPRIAPQPLQ